MIYYVFKMTIHEAFTNYMDLALILAVIYRFALNKSAEYRNARDIQILKNI